jgi:hypothetical protein
VDGLTKQVGTFAAALCRDDIPNAAIEGARTGMTDCVSVLLAGAVEAAPTIGTTTTKRAQDRDQPFAPADQVTVVLKSGSVSHRPFIQYTTQ